MLLSAVSNHVAYIVSEKTMWVKTKNRYVLFALDQESGVEILVYNKIKGTKYIFRPVNISCFEKKHAVR